jgi:hypothetical protein
MTTPPYQPWPPQPTPPAVPPKRKSRVGLVVGIVAGAVVLLVVLLGIIGAALAGNQSAGKTPSVTTPTEFHGAGAVGDPVDSPDLALPTTEPAAAEPAPTAAAAAPISAEQANANGTAADYLSSQHFSRKGLIDQLKYDGFSTKIATRAVDAQKADWNQQAVEVAHDYLGSMHFSKSGLLEQLKYDGFTASQAAYGVSKAYR